MDRKFIRSAAKAYCTYGGWKASLLRLIQCHDDIGEKENRHTRWRERKGWIFSLVLSKRGKEEGMTKSCACWWRQACPTRFKHRRKGNRHLAGCRLSKCIVHVVNIAILAHIFHHRLILWLHKLQRGGEPRLVRASPAICFKMPRQLKLSKLTRKSPRRARRV